MNKLDQLLEHCDQIDALEQKSNLKTITDVEEYELITKQIIMSSVVRSLIIAIKDAKHTLQEIASIIAIEADENTELSIYSERINSLLKNTHVWRDI